MSSEQNWEKIMEENFQSFLKRVNEACKERSGDEEGQGTDPCGKCNREQKNEDYKYLYRVNIGGEDHAFIGNSSFIDDDCNLTIYKNPNKTEVIAYVRDFSYFTVEENDLFLDSYS